MSEFHPMPSHPLFQDLTGRTFGKLTVISYAGKLGRLHKWNCLCQCGVTKAIATLSLNSGHTSSCGCLRLEMLRRKCTLHGKSKTKMFTVWAGMKARCENAGHHHYKNYGGRGIIVCERWQAFANFITDMGDCPKGMTLERLDNNGCYQPGNCRWATRKEQGRNKRNNVLLTCRGETKTVSEWSEVSGVAYNTIVSRIRRSKYDVEKAIFMSVKPLPIQNQTSGN